MTSADFETAAALHHEALVWDAHVGIGLDYFFDSDDGLNATLAHNAHYWPPAQYPQGAVRCAAPAQLVELTAELLRRGHTDAQVRAILGENFLRTGGELSPRRERRMGLIVLL